MPDGMHTCQYIHVFFQIVNVNGSGIGMGHPVGSTGSRIIVSLIYELIASGKKLGLASICGGGGVFLATEVTVEN